MFSFFIFIFSALVAILVLPKQEEQEDGFDVQ